MMLSSIQEKDIINLSDGKKIGTIIDIKISDNGQIEEVSVQKRRFFIFSSSVTTFNWKQIDKIGKDVILIKEMN